MRFGKSPRYWAAKGRATAWAAAYSLQFELGPLSEASIGNVGKRPETTGWVDHVVTPVGALGLMVAEDALDCYLVEWSETRIRNRVFRASMRMLFNPARTLSNSATGRAPRIARAGRLASINEARHSSHPSPVAGGEPFWHFACLMAQCAPS